MKITIDKAVLEMALVALRKCDSALSEELAAWDIDPPLHHVMDASNACGPSIAALREALAQPQQEPMPWKHDCAALLMNGVELWVDHCPHCGKPRTSPPARKPLTDDQYRSAFESFVKTELGDIAVKDHGRYISPKIQNYWLTWQAAHGIKDTP